MGLIDTMVFKLWTWKTLHTGHGFRACREIIQSIPATTATTILCTNETFDTNNEHNPVNGRYTPQVAGYYMIQGNVIFANFEDGKTFIVRIMKNGTTITIDRGVSGANAVHVGGCCSTVVYMNGTTDYLSLEVYHFCTVAINTKIDPGYVVFSGWLLPAP